MLGPVYIAELASAKWRGRMVGLFQINVVSGILLAYLSNYVITLMDMGAKQWRWEFGVAIVPSLLFLILLYGIPHSARWLVTRGRIEEAREVLKLTGSTDLEGEFETILRSLHMEQGEKQEHLFSRYYRKPIFLAITIGLFNQLSGINAILYYSNYIFASAGFNSASAALQTVGVGFVNLAATLLGMSLIDKLGRKTLLLIGSVGMTIALAGVAWVFHEHHHQSVLVWLLITFILFFSISQGSVIWVYIAEVFPSRVRSKGQSIGSSSHWIMNALIAWAFPFIASRSQAIPFAFFATMMLLQFVVVLFIYPETKGSSLEAIQEKLGLGTVAPEVPR